MYREHETSAKKGSVSTTQLVLPTNLREGVMEVAHDSILGGHLGGKKTLDRVTSNFHWPGPKTKKKNTNSTPNKSQTQRLVLT